MNAQKGQEFRVVLVEDHPMFREQLAELINKEASMRVCGEADNIHDALRLIESEKPDIAIVDLTLKGPSGLELIKNLKARELDVPVLVLSMHDEALYAERVLKAGARGYITKNEVSKEEMTGQGRSTREISNYLHLGVSTVDTYRARIKTKLHLENSSQLCHEAIRWVSDGQKVSA